MTTRAAAAEATRERIVEVALDAFSNHWYDEVTIRGIARDAGVALQTVRNHFGSKDELLGAAVESLDTEIKSVRFAVEPGDVDGAIATLVDDYERNGEATLRMLAVEPRVPAIQPFMDRGRAGHRAWVERVFADAVRGLRGKARDRRIAELVVVTDVYAWKLLRRDREFGRDETIAAMRELVLALHDNSDKES